MRNPMVMTIGILGKRSTVGIPKGALVLELQATVMWLMTRYVREHVVGREHDPMET